MKTALFIIANHGFQDTEFGVPKKMLEDAGVRIEVAAGNKGKCIGKFGTEVNAEYKLSETSGADYDLVVFIGGPGAEKQYTGNQEYFRLAKEAKILAAICIAPTVLSYSGIFEGKSVTGWDRNGEKQAQIETNGGDFTGAEVTIDGNIITANGPEAAENFGTALLRALEL